MYKERQLMQDLRIAVVQMTSRVGETEHNLRTIERFVHQAIAANVDILCFPELCISGYNAGDNEDPAPESLDGDWVQKLAAVSSATGLTFLAGLLERDIDGIIYNRHLVPGRRIARFHSLKSAFRHRNMLRLTLSRSEHSLGTARRRNPLFTTRLGRRNGRGKEGALAALYAGTSV
jgi:hypothetical protein